MVAELVDAHNLVDDLALFPANTNLITGNNVPVFDTVLRLCRLYDGVSECHPPLPMTIVREKVTKGFGVRASRPGLEDLILPEHFCDRHCRVVVRCRVQTVGNTENGDGQPEELLA